ncbi:UNVERIFIED_CONTAM: protein argonaute 5 [Sesamum radiatum]|uniref:Protein argonaute 5 n=1 Tax=Sesamum radiatum TaxID=300843 RepID=A0AAW2UKH2_SESRA
MSGRGGGGGGGRGRGGGGRGQYQSPSGGRGQQQSRGGGTGRGRGRGTNAPPVSSSSASAQPFEQSMPQDAAALGSAMEQRLTLQGSSSTLVPPPQPQIPAAVAVDRPEEQPQLPPSSMKEWRPPSRPGFGTVGHKVIVKANHFLVTAADLDLNHYDVSISPEVSSKKVCREIMNQLVNSFHASHLGKRRLAYDGRKSCYTAGQLPFSSKDFVVKLVDKDSEARREREFKVSIKFAAKADLHHLKQFLQSRQHDFPQETLQCLDVVLRVKPSNSYEVVGRSFFSPELGRMGSLVMVWNIGKRLQCRVCQNSLSKLLSSHVADMSARAFFEPILVSEYVFKYFNRDLTRPLSDQDRLKAGSSVKPVFYSNGGVQNR